LNIALRAVATVYAGKIRRYKTGEKELDPLRFYAMDTKYKNPVAQLDFLAPGANNHNG
jgi:hypothetical protein